MPVDYGFNSLSTSGTLYASGISTSNIDASGYTNISGVLTVGNVLNISGINPSLFVYNPSSPGYSYIGFKDTAGSEQFKMIYDANDQESTLLAGNYRLRITSVSQPIDLYAGGQMITIDPDGSSTQISGRTRIGSNIGVTPSSILHIDGAVTNSGSLIITGGTSNNAIVLANGNSDTMPILSSLNYAGNYGWGFFDRATDGHFRLRRRNNSTNWTDVFNIARDTGTIGVSGSIGVGTSSPSGAFHVFGSGYHTGNLVVTNLVTASSGNITTLTTVPTVLSPSALGTDQNDWNPGVGDIIRLSASTTGIDITGMVLRNEYTRVLINIGTANNVTLKHQSGSSTAANRFITSTGGDHIIPPSGTTTVLYDSVDSRWRIL